MRIAQLSAGVLKWPPASEATHKVRSHLRPGNRPGYVTVCHSFNSEFAWTIFGFFSCGAGIIGHVTAPDAHAVTVRSTKPVSKK